MPPPIRVWGFQDGEGQKVKMLYDTCEFLQVTPFVVFALAYEVAQDHSHDEDMEEFFLSHTRPAKFGFVTVQKVPQVVEDFCLNILTGRLVIRMERRKKPRPPKKETEGGKNAGETHTDETPS